MPSMSENAVPQENYSDESDVILTPEDLSEVCSFFIAVQLDGDNTLHFKSFVKSK